MPELPEVETIARSLRPHIVDRTVVAVDVRCASLRQPLPRGFKSHLCGRRIVAARRRGKYLIVGLDRGPAWLVHFGMSGRLTWVPGSPPGPRLRHDHVIVSLDDGAELVYHDPRRFGLMALVHPDRCELLGDLGPEPFDAEAFNGTYLFETGRRSRRTIKDALMDQTLVAGIGNIYANEILFRARVRPRRQLGRLSRSSCDRIVDAARYVLEEAIRHRGASMADFLDGIGRRGGYQWHRRVYRRAGEPCPECGKPIKGIVVGQRSTFYCPSCQR